MNNLKDDQEWLRNNYYDVIQKDMKGMIEFYQQHIALLEEMKPTKSPGKTMKKETKMEMLRAIIYRTEDFMCQLKSIGERIERSI